MAQTDALKKYLDAGMAFTQLTRSKAEQVVKELVAAGELQKNQAKSAIDDLVERSKRNAELLAEQVRKEVDSQLSNMGLARKADVDKLVAELARLKGSEGASSGADEPAPAKQAPARKAPATKAPATKAPATKAPAKKDTGGPPVGADLPGPAAAEDKGDAKPAPVKKAPAKKAPGTTAPANAASGGSPVGDDEPAAAKKAPAKKTAKKQG